MNAFRKIKVVTATAAMVAIAAVGLSAQAAGAATNNFRSSGVVPWGACSVQVWLQQNTSATGWPVAAAGNVNCSGTFEKTVGTVYLKGTNPTTGKTYQTTASTTFTNSYGMGSRWLFSPSVAACSGYKVQGVFTVTITDHGHTYSTYVTTSTPVLPPSTLSC